MKFCNVVETTMNLVDVFLHYGDTCFAPFLLDLEFQIFYEKSDLDSFAAIPQKSSLKKQKRKPEF